MVLALVSLPFLRERIRHVHELYPLRELWC